MAMYGSHVFCVNLSYRVLLYSTMIVTTAFIRSQEKESRVNRFENTEQHITEEIGKDNSEQVSSTLLNP